MSESASSSSSSSSAASRKTVADLLGPGVMKDPKVVGAKVAGRVVDVHTPIDVPEGAKVEALRASDPEGLAIIRHSTAHVMADAVQRLFPGTKVAFGPATDAGFYYDFQTPKGVFTDDDLVTIEAKIKEIVAAKRPFRREVVSHDEAAKILDAMGETFKREHLDRLPAGADISIYRHGDGNGEWLDLCEGPHIPHTGFIGAVKLTSVAGAYWRGDERNPMLQRIYGTAFSTESELKEHLRLLEEAKARDHRKLGKELELFMFHEYAPAMPFLLPKGAFVYNALIAYVRDLYVRYGYDEVITPQIFDKKLFETSGHWGNYRENMYLPMTADDIDQAKMALRIDVSPDAAKESYREADHARDQAVVQHLSDIEHLGAKPMNCPSHCLIFGQRRRSYRELPWRIADFGRLHRYERGGVVHGLARVRSFCQDDAHIFCRPDQMQVEISDFIDLLDEVYEAFGFDRVDVKLATRPDKRMGTEEMWDLSEGALHEALQKRGRVYEVLPGEGAFYGPKLEFHIHDALKRSWQLGTIQVDYNLPERFDLEFAGDDGHNHRPVMLHRAILGSLERFLSVLIEHCNGAFPMWLAPEHATIVTISEKQADYAREVQRELIKHGLRAKVDAGSDKLGAKIRNARLMRVPYVVVVGDKEVEARCVAPRSRDLNKDLGSMPLADFVARLVEEAKAPRRPEAPPAPITAASDGAIASSDAANTPGDGAGAPVASTGS